MLERLPDAHPDPLVQALALVSADPSPQKTDLGVGVYKDESGDAPILSAVKKAERSLLETQRSKSYISSAGAEEFNARVEALLFGERSGARAQGRVATIQTVGCSGALRVAAELVRKCDAGIVWIPDQTWANHEPILQAASLSTRRYPYYDRTSRELSFSNMIDALKSSARGDVVLLHGCCHNPSGADLDLDQWEIVANLLETTGAAPLIDIAYQGFADGVEADAAGLRLLAERLPETLIANSCSKNFGLYRDRTGSLSVVAPDAGRAEATLRNLMKIVRVNYSTPPDHGAAIVARILGSAELRAEWLAELATMRLRIKSIRERLAELLNDGRTERFNYLRAQNGMFSFLDIAPDGVERLRADHHIHVVANGRVNVAGLTSENIERVAAALRQEIV